MDLRNFPHDVQACTMRFRSYAYFVEELNFTLMSLRENERFLQNDAYSLEGLDGAVGTTRTCLEENKCRNYAEAVVTLTLKRDITFYAYQVSQFHVSTKLNAHYPSISVKFCICLLMLILVLADVHSRRTYNCPWLRLMCQWSFLLNGAELSLNSVNSGNLINHRSMNWAHFQDPVSHMCLAGAVVASWCLIQEVAGVMRKILLLNSLNSVKLLGKTPLFPFQQ